MMNDKLLSQLLVDAWGHWIVRTSFIERIPDSESELWVSGPGLYVDENCVLTGSVDSRRIFFNNTYYNKVIAKVQHILLRKLEREDWTLYVTDDIPPNSHSRALRANFETPGLI